MSKYVVEGVDDIFRERHIPICSYCGRRAWGRIWFDPFSTPSTTQCQRLFCRFASGHLYRFRHDLCRPAKGWVRKFQRYTWR